VKILHAIIISVVLMSLILFSGCNEKKGNNVEKGSSFNIKSFWITDDNGITCIILEYQAVGKSKIVIKTPTGEKITREIDENDSAMSIPISKPMYSAPRGNYSIKVKSLEGTNYDSVLYNNTIWIKGSEIEILGITSLWKHTKDDYKDVLYDLSIILRNKGDVPAYPYYAELIIDNISYGTFCIRGSNDKIVQSGERKVLKLNFTEIRGISPNFSHELKLIIYDKYGQILDKYTQIRKMNLT